MGGVVPQHPIWGIHPEIAQHQDKHFTSWTDSPPSFAHSLVTRDLCHLSPYHNSSSVW